MRKLSVLMMVAGALVIAGAVAFRVGSSFSRGINDVLAGVNQ